MAIGYYDNLFATNAENLPGYIEIERIYLFNFDEFDDSHWQTISRIYEGLPGAVRNLNVPWWFGVNEESLPFLSASVEPSGLQVYGVLLEDDWLEWDRLFRDKAAGLPMRVLE